MAKSYGSSTGIKAGDSVLLNVGVGRFLLWSTGIKVIFDDDTSFTFTTPEGHSFAGWITFSATPTESGLHVLIDVLIRASDPLYELLMAFGGHRGEDWQWRMVLRNLARRVGVEKVRPRVSYECVDRRRQWRQWRNVRGNAAVRTFAYVLTHPRASGRPALPPRT